MLKNSCYGKSRTTLTIPTTESANCDRQSDRKKSNGTGTAGFVFALITIFLGWIPVFGWILWILGLILSLVGLARQPRGLAIAGLVISLLGLILLLVVFGAIIGAASLL